MQVSTSAALVKTGEHLTTKQFFPCSKLRRLLVVGCMLAMVFLAVPADADTLVMGFNVVNPMERTTEERHALLDQLSTARVHVVRFALKPLLPDIEFANALYKKGIAIVLIVNPQFRADAPVRHYQPKLYPGMWGGHPLSSADLKLTNNFIERLLSMLEAKNIVLEGLELGNEINWTAFNAEFPLPGKGNIFGLADLYKDTEARKIANGYVKYVDLLAGLWQIRGKTKLNRRTPIISAGLSPAGEPHRNSGKFPDAVSINATIEFLRAHGVDRFVDAYGIHIYPNETSEPARDWAIKTQYLAECRAPGSVEGKPCWITEWGLETSGASCLSSQTREDNAVTSIIRGYVDFASRRRLYGALYYAWNKDTSDDEVDPYAVFQGGSLTTIGKTLVREAQRLTADGGSGLSTYDIENRTKPDRGIFNAQ